MFIFRFLILVFIVSYLFWYISNKILHKKTRLIEITSYSILIFGGIGLFLWLLSYLIEGLGYG